MDLMIFAVSLDDVLISSTTTDIRSMACLPVSTISLDSLVKRFT